MRNKSICIVLLTVLSGSILNAQNVGINTTTPQTTLDVKGSMRAGGISHYVKNDSTGRIDWYSSNLYVPVSQFLMKHSAAGDGLYYNNTAPTSGQLEYRNEFGNPVFFTNFTNGKGYFSGDVGLGITSPQHKLHLFTGASGSTPPFGYNQFALESAGNINMSFLTPDGGESTIWFSKPSKPFGGGIFYNNPVAPDGFVFLANNAPRMAITNSGKVGIGLNSPFSALHIMDGASGAFSPHVFSRLALESNGHTYLNLISPDANETAILFGKATDPVSGVIMYNNPGNLNGLQFRTNGNTTQMVIDNLGRVGIGTTNPNAPLTFPPALGKKITLYPGTTGDVGLGVQGNLLQIYSDNPNADIAFGYDQAGVLNEKFRIKANGALSVSGNSGNAGQLLQSTGAFTAPSWVEQASLKTIYYQINITPASLVGGSNFTMNIPVTVNVNSIITASITTNLVTGFFGGCIDGNLAINLERGGGSSLVASMGKFNYPCGKSTYTISTGEISVLNTSGGMFTFSPGTATLIITFTNISGSPTVSVGTTDPAKILIKVIPL